MSSSDKSAAFCSWGDDCRVGIQKLDDQHKGLFATLNRFYDILMSHGAPALIDKELLNLLRQTQVHFAAEEKLMQENDYPGLQLHKEIHDFLLSQLEDVLTLESNGYDQPWIERLETADFLHAWLVAHIKDEDKELGAWLQNRQQGAI